MLEVTSTLWTPRVSLMWFFKAPTATMIVALFLLVVRCRLCRTKVVRSLLTLLETGRMWMELVRMIVVGVVVVREKNKIVVATTCNRKATFLFVPTYPPLVF